MKRMLASSGYTIVEVLMFLAVSGGLLVAVMALVSGEQAKTEFTTSLRSFEAQMQDVLNDVSTGTFPAMNNKSCTVGPGVNDRPMLDGSAATQGSNRDCIFVGKAVQFSPEGSNSGGRFNVYTIAGKRQMTAAGKQVEVGNISEAKPTIINADATAIDTSTLNSSLVFKKVLVGGVETYGFSLVSAFGKTSSLGGTVSGSSGASIMKLTLARDAATSSATSAVEALQPTDVVTQPIVICVGDTGSGGRLGAIRIDGRGTEILFDNDAVTAGCNV